LCLSEQSDVDPEELLKVFDKYDELAKSKLSPKKFKQRAGSLKKELDGCCSNKMFNDMSHVLLLKNQVPPNCLDMDGLPIDQGILKLKDKMKTAFHREYDKFYIFVQDEIESNIKFIALARWAEKLMITGYRSPLNPQCFVIVLKEKRTFMHALIEAGISSVVAAIAIDYYLSLIEK
jgi:hypothetical protein